MSVATVLPQFFFWRALKIGEGGPEKQVFNLLWPYSEVVL